jgi:MFS family permease
MIMVALMTLIQRRTPQAIMGRVSTAIEVVMATPQAVSLALGSLLVVLLSYRQIFVIIGVVTAIAAAYIAVLLRDQIAADVRRPMAAVQEPAPAVVEAAVDAALPTTPPTTFPRTLPTSSPTSATTPGER